MLDTSKFEGTVSICLTDAQGNTIDERNIKNLIVTTGRAYMANRISGVSTPGAMGWLEVGTGTAAAAMTDIKLGAYIAGGRVVTSAPSITTTDYTNDTFVYVATLGAGTPATPQNITEAGLFNSATPDGGTMLNRIVFAPIGKGVSDTLTFTWKIKVSA